MSWGPADTRLGRRTRDRRRRRGALPPPGRGQRRCDPGAGAWLRMGSGGHISDAGAGADRIERARTQVGNLAHALKTPLSVLINEADSGSPNLPAKVREQAEIMRRQVGFYLDRARAAARARAIGIVTDVKPVVEGLVRTFEKLHAERSLNFNVELQDGLRFRGESQDLTDLIGNLLDNAGKWARET